MEEGEGIGGRGTKRHGGYISLVSATQQILVFLSVTQRCSVFPVSGSLHLRLSQALLSASPAHPTTAGLLGTRLSLCTYPDSLPLHPQYHPNIFPPLGFKGSITQFPYKRPFQISPDAFWRRFFSPAQVLPSGERFGEILELAAGAGG